jgi:hypothetical protein
MGSFAFEMPSANTQSDHNGNAAQKSYSYNNSSLQGNYSVLTTRLFDEDDENMVAIDEIYDASES